jgi:hypothetical protein
MAENFVEADVLTNEETMADNAVAALQEQWDDWEPSEGDLEVVQIEVLAQMASDAAETAAVMPPAAFEQVMQLFGVDPNPGTPSTGLVTFTLVDATTQLIPAGTEIDVDGYAFTTDDDVITAGTTAASVPITAVDTTTEANDLPGDAVAMLSALAFVVSVALVGHTGGGVDPEDENAYLDRGSLALELQALTLVTGRDYELLALTQAYVQRVSALANTATRSITVTASKADGTALVAADKTSLLALYDSYRQTNWTVAIGDPTKTTINVTFTVHIYQDFLVQGVLDEAAQFVRDYLNAATWPAATYTRDQPTTWAIEPYVRRNKIVDVIANAHGVDYVSTVTITGSAGTAQGNGDWLMPGTVPLPAAGTITGTAV